MKRISTLLFGLALLPFMEATAQAPENPVTELHKRLQQAIQFAAEPLKEFDSRYVEELKKLKEKIQKEGNLEKALQVQHEIENYAKPEERNFSDTPDLRRLREIYDQTRTQRVTEVRKKQEEILKQAIGKFDQLKESLTKQGKLEQAVEADTFRKKFITQLEALPGADVTGGLNLLWTLRSKGDFKSVLDCDADRKGDAWVLSSEQKHMSYIESDKSFRPPFSARGRIGTDSVEIRFFYAGKQLVIFNWSSNPQQLRIQNPIGGRAKGFQGTGYLEKNKVHDVEIQITPTKIRVLAAGELRGELSGDFKELEGPFGIGPAFGSKITIESLQVSELKAD